MPIDLMTLTPMQAKPMIDLPPDRKAELVANRAYYEGDHFQNWRAWGGPVPIVPEGLSRAKQEVVTALQKEIADKQVTVNAIKEVVERESGAAVGIEPTWSFGPDGIQMAHAEPKPGDPPIDPAIATRSAALDARATQLNSEMTVWWDEKGVHQQLQKLADRLLYGAGAIKGESEATIRLYIPAAMLENEVIDGKATGKKVFRAKSRQDALSKIFVETMDADTGRVVFDATTLTPIGIKITKHGDDEVAELAYVDANKKTVIATVRADVAKTVSRAFDLGGRMTMFTVSRAEFLTEQIRQCQKALNFSAFVIRRNTESAGFLQDTLLNGELPSHYEGEGDNRKLVLDPIQRGPLSFNSFGGKPIQNEQGDVTGYTSASLDHRQPVDPAPTIAAKSEQYGDILGAVSQRHVMMSDVVASAPARVQALGEHVKSVRKTVTPTQKVARALMESAIVWADALASESSASTILDGLRCTVTCIIDTGPVTPDVRAQNLAELNAGAKSLESTIEQNGTNDVDAEIARIQKQPLQGLDVELKRAQIFAAWIGAGVGESEAARRAGIPDEEIPKLVTAPTDTTTVTQ